jgi:hypothetical protein
LPTTVCWLPPPPSWLSAENPLHAAPVVPPPLLLELLELELLELELLELELLELELLDEPPVVEAAPVLPELELLPSVEPATLPALEPLPRSVPVDPLPMSVAVVPEPLELAALLEAAPVLPAPLEEPALPVAPVAPELEPLLPRVPPTSPPTPPPVWPRLWQVPSEQDCAPTHWVQATPFKPQWASVDCWQTALVSQQPVQVLESQVAPQPARARAAAAAARRVRWRSMGDPVGGGRPSSTPARSR